MGNFTYKHCSKLRFWDNLLPRENENECCARKEIGDSPSYRMWRQLEKLEGNHFKKMKRKIGAIPLISEWSKNDLKTIPSRKCEKCLGCKDLSSWLWTKTINLQEVANTLCRNLQDMQLLSWFD